MVHRLETLLTHLKTRALFLRRFRVPSLLTKSVHLPHLSQVLLAVPFLRNGGIASSSLPSLKISNSCPVTPPLSSPTCNNPKPLTNWDSIAKQSMANAKRSVSSFNYPFYAKFAQQQKQPFSGSMVPASPTFNLMKPSLPLGMSPNVAAAFQGFGQGSEFKFENSQVKPWEGERIHDVGMEDLELTLGNGKKARG
ncbi:hypothetical protein HID58_047453 [Brassica napus]|uniref:Protein BZR1 homolog n=1 Tax=Brassica napus TaxID=3708 RepID=A0ABQ8AZA6_BRANA|nr:hypothetical protein HID58_047453 [Brassica napus]